MSSDEQSPTYLANLRRELTRALARLKRAELERDRALAENARLRGLIEKLGTRASDDDVR
jgi:hypothetical protein